MLRSTATRSRGLATIRTQLAGARRALVVLVRRARRARRADSRADARRAGVGDGEPEQKEAGGGAAVETILSQFTAEEGPSRKTSWLRASRQQRRRAPGIGDASGDTSSLDASCRSGCTCASASTDSGSCRRAVAAPESARDVFEDPPRRRRPRRPSRRPRAAVAHVPARAEVVGDDGAATFLAAAAALGRAAAAARRRAVRVAHRGRAATNSTARRRRLAIAALAAARRARNFTQFLEPLLYARLLHSVCPRHGLNVRHRAERCSRGLRDGSRSLRFSRLDLVAADAEVLERRARLERFEERLGADVGDVVGSSSSLRSVAFVLSASAICSAPWSPMLFSLSSATSGWRRGTLRAARSPVAARCSRG